MQDLHSVLVLCNCLIDNVRVSVYSFCLLNLCVLIREG